MKRQNRRALVGISARIATLTLILVNIGVAHILARQIHTNSSLHRTSVKDSRISAPALGVITETDAVASVNNHADGGQSIATYQVQDGDTLSSIAAKFHISINTIRWANDLAPHSKIRIGQTLTILPVTGIEYTVVKGDSLEGIARKFDSSTADILTFNDIDGSDIKAGMKLVIPDAEPIAKSLPHVTTSPKKATPPEVVSQLQSSDEESGGVQSDTTPNEPVPAGYFIDPMPGSVLTQGLHGYNAVDFGGPIGTDVRAAAAGTVIVAKGSGYNGGYGKYMVISHANGSQTLYGHLSKIDVLVGTTVTQGQHIALSGATGHVTGPHLHFEVRGGTNPFIEDRRGTQY